MKYSFDILEYTIIDGSEHYLSRLRTPKSDLIYLNDNYSLKISSRQVMLCDSNENYLWPTPLKCPGIPNNAWISDNRIMITTSSEDYHAWGHLGPAIIVDRDSGVIIKEIRGSHGEALSGGRFIIGLEGYDVFDTWLYDDRGELVQQWRSCGHYIVSEDNTIRVIEQDRRIPTKGYVVRLNGDGTVYKGFKLKTCSTSNPIKLANEELLFDHSGELIMLDRNLSKIAQLKLLTKSEKENWRFSSRIILENKNELNVFIMERTKGDRHPIKYKTHEWKVKISRD